MMPITLTVTDLKQYWYCPRVMYYRRCLPGLRPTTVKMVEGIAAHDDAEVRERRRQLRTYGFASGERHFDVPIYSPQLGLTAQIDLIILRPDGAQIAVPVDYKLSDRVSHHFEVQLACYGLVVEEEIGLPAAFGFLYLIPERRAVKVKLTDSLRRQVRQSATEIRAIVEHEAMPDPSQSVARCVNCEFRRFCNDVR